MKTQNILLWRGALRCSVLALLAVVLWRPFAYLFNWLFGVRLSVETCLFICHETFRHPFPFCCLLFFMAFAVLWYRSDGALRRFYFVWLVFFALMYCPGTLAFLSVQWTVAMQGDFLVSLASYLFAFMCFMVLLLCVCGFSAWYSKQGSDEDSEEAGAPEPHH